MVHAVVQLVLLLPRPSDHRPDVRPQSGHESEQSDARQQKILGQAESSPAELAPLEENWDEGEQVEEGGEHEGQEHAGGDPHQGDDPLQVGHRSRESDWRRKKKIYWRRKIKVRN